MSDKIKLKKLVNEFDVEKIYTNLSKSNYFYNVDMIFKDKKLNQSFKRKIIRKLKGESVDFLTFFSKKSPTLEVGDELRQVLDRVINTHYTKISRKQRKADR